MNNSNKVPWQHHVTGGVVDMGDIKSLHLSGPKWKWCGKLQVLVGRLGTKSIETEAISLTANYTL